MVYNFTVSPDFSPDYISGWFIFNTWLQRRLDLHVHLEMYNDFSEQHRAMRDDRIDLIYANPYDATELVRERGFVPLVRPAARQDEAVIVVHADHPAQAVEDLEAGLTVASTDDPDVNMIAMIMLEPADLDQDTIRMVSKENHLLVAKAVLRGEAKAGFILAEAYDEFSEMLHKQLRVLVRSAIRDINHTLMAGPKLAAEAPRIQEALLTMTSDPKGPGVLEGLNISAWEKVEQEDMEFMIDLMDTLAS